MVRLETTDLFRSAFFLASGGNLAEVRIRNNGRKIATFLITGVDLDRLDNDYRSGRALVNPVQLRESLNHLRDVLFTRLRENNHPAPRLRQAGGRYENDSKRGDRIDQARR